MDSAIREVAAGIRRASKGGHMAARTTKKRRTKAVGTAARARKAMQREAKSVYGEIETGVKHLEKSIAEIQKGLVRAEKKIEKDARAKIASLRKEARGQLGTLKTMQRRATAVLDRLSSTADESWHEVVASGQSIMKDARKTANSVVMRFRKAVGA
jgi:hypothetical protein